MGLAVIALMVGAVMMTGAVSLAQEDSATPTPAAETDEPEATDDALTDDDSDSADDDATDDADDSADDSESEDREDDGRGCDHDKDELEDDSESGTTTSL